MILKCNFKEYRCSGGCFYILMYYHCLFYSSSRYFVKYLHEQQLGVLSPVTVRLFMTFCKSLDIDYYCLHLLSRRNRLLASFLYNKHFRKSQFKSLPILGYKNDLFTLSCFWGLYQVSTETNVQ